MYLGNLVQSWTFCKQDFHGQSRQFRTPETYLAENLSKTIRPSYLVQTILGIPKNRIYDFYEYLWADKDIDR
jgi:hypothetical protein